MISNFSLHRLIHDQRGSVMIIAGLSLLVLTAVSGAAIDFGHQQLVRAKLQQATDAAAIAAASMDSSVSNAARRTAAERYFSLNFPDGYMGVKRPAPTVSVSDSSIRVVANANLKTRFMGFIGVNRMTSSGITGINRDTITTASKYDLILVMDVSGSMIAADAGGGKTRIQAQQEAANTIASNLLSPNTTDSRVAAITWSDAVANAINFQSAYGPVRAFNNAMHVVAGTNSTAGLDRAINYSSGFRSDAVKAVVLITDGYNGANVPPFSTYAVNRASLIDCTQLKNTGAVVYTIAFGQTINQACATYQCPPGKCNDGLHPNNPNDPELCAKPFLQTCASTPANFFPAPDSTQLTAAFQAILTSIQNMRVVE